MASSSDDVMIWFLLVNQHHRPIYDQVLFVDFPADGDISDLESSIRKNVLLENAHTCKDLEVHGIWQCTDQTTKFTRSGMYDQVKDCFRDNKVRKLDPMMDVQDLHLLDKEVLLVEATMAREVWYLVVNNDMKLISVKISGVVAHTIAELIRSAELGQCQGTVVVWRSMLKKLSTKATLDDLIEMIREIDLHDRAQAIPLANSMLVTDVDVDEVLLVQVPGPDEEGEHETLHLPLPSDENLNLGAWNASEDQLASYSYQDYEKTYKRIGGVKTPSANSKSTEYCKNQAIEHDIIYDGLCAPGEGAPITSAPPIHMYHPIFWQFTRDANDPSIIPDPDFLKNVRGFMGASCQVGNDGNDASNSSQQLEELLEWSILAEINDDGSELSGTMMFDHFQAQIPVAIVTLRRSLGVGGCDPTIEATNLMRKNLGEEESKSIVEKCCCPVFMLVAGGPWLCILGGVFVNQFIVQRLTDMMWIGFAATHEDHRVHQVARVLFALKNNLHWQGLKYFYQSVAATKTIPKYHAHRNSHPRHFPYFNCFIDHGGALVVFEYLGRLERDMRCVTFLAKVIAMGEKVVVKFVDRYGAEVHQFLAEQGHAPKLLYYGPLPDRTTYSPSKPYPAAQKPMNAGHHRLGPAVAPEMKMVVMEYIARSKPRLDNLELARDKILTVLEKLHANGYVFGDVRNVNVMFVGNKEVKFIDFDWAGRYDINELPLERQEDIRKTWTRLSQGLNGSCVSGRYTTTHTVEERAEVEEILKKLLPRTGDAADYLSRYDNLTADERTKVKNIGSLLDNLPCTSFVCYPVGISLSIPWPEGVEPCVPILPRHDIAMLDGIYFYWMRGYYSFM